MARFGFHSFTCCCIMILLEKAVAPPPSSVIEAYKPTTSTTEYNSGFGFGGLGKLKKMLSDLEHEIDDIDAQRRFMKAQMKQPLNDFFPIRMEPALEYTDTSQPSRVYRNKKIMSASGVFLQIFDDGTANGTNDNTSPYTNLTIEMVGVDGKMQIKGQKGNKYLTCTKSGKFQAVSKGSGEAVFSSVRPPKPGNGNKSKAWHISLWKSNKYRNLHCDLFNWWMGFRHNDKLKKGRHSRRHQLGSWFIIL